MEVGSHKVEGKIKIKEMVNHVSIVINFIIQLMSANPNTNSLCGISKKMKESRGSSTKLLWIKSPKTNKMIKKINKSLNIKQAILHRIRYIRL